MEGKGRGQEKAREKTPGGMRSRAGKGRVDREQLQKNWHSQSRIEGLGKKRKVLFENASDGSEGWF